MRNKPLTRTEMKILIYNKMKKGMSYDDAVAELDKEIQILKKEKQVRLG